MTRWLKVIAALLLVTTPAFAGRDGSGTYTIPNVAVSGGVISSSDYNENFSDVGTEITNSLPRDGQAGMTGQFKATDGTVALPGISFLSDTNTGIYRISADTFGLAAGGALIATISPTGIAINTGLAITGWSPNEAFVVAASDETTAITTGTSKVTWRMPYALTVTSVKCNLTTAQTAGSIFTVDINESGSTILSTKVTIDNNEKTSVTAATPPVISDTAIAADAEMSIDVDQIGTSGAAGLKCAVIGHQ